DGCPLSCCEKVLGAKGVTPRQLVQLHDLGLKKRKHVDFEPAEQDRVFAQVLDELGPALLEADPSLGPRIDAARAESIAAEGGDKTGVLLVNHGSRAAGWRRMLLDVHAQAESDLLAIPGVAQVRSAFMEYAEPSIATQLRAFDAAGIETVIVVPLLLTISDHTFDDIPAICGLHEDEARLTQLREEKIEVYAAEAELRFAPLLDFSGLVRTNLARRVRAIVGRPPPDPGARRDGLVLVGYGSAEFEDEWTRFFAEARGFAESELGFVASAHAWCGHIVGYRRAPTIEAIESVLRVADRAIVLPVLVAYDPMFQERIIGRAVERCAAPDRVLYRPDSILPEPAVARWVVDVARRMAPASA
ncbi:MAG: hypothetical protein J0H06_07950, partial [Actinobacteria bacterium]|nr:hypothetical protein [Actinomycetota bacterium]